MATKLPIVLFFVFLTFCCWGTYGPVLHIGQEAMGSGRLRPFICVGIAYFIVAVIIPLIIGPRIHEPGKWTIRGILWSLFAGTIGALGSLGVIFAFNAGGKPVFVMPLVFGCAPVVNTIVTMLTSRSSVRPGVLFYVGIALVAFGAAGVLKFKPKPVVAAVADVESAESEADAEEVLEAGANESREERDEVESQTFLGWLGTIACILLTAICWGCYGPTLHQGQARMAGSRLRPFICVGIAYFMVAIVIPAGILMQTPEAGAWTISGSLWSLGAGALGAIGALGVIMAFTFGGKPSYVMPLVFGGAPIVNTATSMGQSLIKTGSIGDIPTAFLIALAIVITGAVLVLLFAPKAHPAKGSPTNEGRKSPPPTGDSGATSAEKATLAGTAVGSADADSSANQGDSQGADPS